MSCSPAPQVTKDWIDQQLTYWKEYFDDADRLKQVVWDRAEPAEIATVEKEKKYYHLLHDEFKSRTREKFDYFLMFTVIHTNSFAGTLLASLSKSTKWYKTRVSHLLSAQGTNIHISLLSLSILLRKSEVTQEILNLCKDKINKFTVNSDAWIDKIGFTPLDHAILAKNKKLICTIEKLFPASLPNKLGLTSPLLKEMILDKSDQFTILVNEKKYTPFEFSQVFPQYKNKHFQHGISLQADLVYTVYFDAQNEKYGKDHPYFPFMKKVIDHFTFINHYPQTRAKSSKNRHVISLKLENNTLCLTAGKMYREGEIIYFMNGMIDKPEFPTVINKSGDVWGAPVTFLKHSFPNATFATKGGVPVLLALDPIQEGDLICVDNGEWNPSRYHFEFRLNELKSFLKERSLWEIPKLLFALDAYNKSIKKKTKEYELLQSHLSINIESAEAASIKLDLTKKSEKLKKYKKRLVEIENVLERWVYIFCHSPSFFKIILWDELTQKQRLDFTLIKEKYLNKIPSLPELDEKKITASNNRHSLYLQWFELLINHCPKSHERDKILQLLNKGKNLINNYISILDDQILPHFKERIWDVFFRDESIILNSIQQLTEKNFTQIFSEKLANLKSEQDLEELIESQRGLFEIRLNQSIDNEVFAKQIIDYILNTSCYYYLFKLRFSSESKFKGLPALPKDIYISLPTSYNAKLLLIERLAKAVRSNPLIMNFFQSYSLISFFDHTDIEKIQEVFRKKNHCSSEKDSEKDLFNRKIYREICFLIHSILQNSDFSQKYFHVSYNPLIPKECLLTDKQIKDIYNEVSTPYDNSEPSMKEMTENFCYKIASEKEIILLFLQNLFSKNDISFRDNCVDLNITLLTQPLKLELLRIYLNKIETEEFAKKVITSFRDFMALNIHVLTKKQLRNEEESDEEIRGGHDLKDSLEFFSSEKFVRELDNNIHSFFPVLLQMLSPSKLKKKLSKVNIDNTSSPSSMDSPRRLSQASNKEKNK